MLFDDGFMGPGTTSRATRDAIREEEEEPHWRSAGPSTTFHASSAAKTKTQTTATTAKAENRAIPCTYRDFVTAYQRSGSVNYQNATAIEKPIADPAITYDPTGLLHTEYQIRHRRISKERLKPLRWLIPFTVISFLAIPCLLFAVSLWIVWAYYAVKNKEEDIRMDLRIAEAVDPMSADMVNRMRRIVCGEKGTILESDAGREIVFARQYYKRYLTSHVIDKREYNILMAPFLDEAKEILKRAKGNPEGHMNLLTFKETTLFRYRLDPIALSDEAVREYCETMSPVFDDTGEHADAEKLADVDPYMDTFLGKYGDLLMDGIDHNGNPC